MLSTLQFTKRNKEVNMDCRNLIYFAATVAVFFEDAVASKYIKHVL